MIRRKNACVTAEGEKMRERWITASKGPLGTSTIWKLHEVSRVIVRRREGETERKRETEMGDRDGGRRRMDEGRKI